MQISAYCSRPVIPGNRHITQLLFVMPPGQAGRHRTNSRLIIRAMKLTMLFLTATFLHVYASGVSQTVTLSAKELTLKQVFAAVKKQTGYTFFYNQELLENTNPVTLSTQDMPLQRFLELTLKNQPLEFTISYNSVILSRKSNVDKSMAIGGLTAPVPVTGTIRDQEGKALTGINVLVKGTKNGTVTDAAGGFALNADPGSTLIITSVGYETQEVKVLTGPVLIVLKQRVSVLDETQVIGYGTSTRRLNTGSVGIITAAEIDKQPVTNVLSALSGRISGVFIQTTNGLPGGNINVQIRGKGSVLAGTDPLYIVDGVPFASSVVPSSTQTDQSVVGIPSPLNSINPSDIESITVLKDADATAIYGSRGTNGVVLITTKKGRAGKTKVDLNISQGITQIADLPRLLTLEQQLQLRKEAFINDGLTPSVNQLPAISYAPDLLLWKQSDGMDWVKYLMGGTGHSTNAQAGISGGNATTNFNISGNYRRESTVLPGDNTYQRGGMFITIQHRTLNNKFSIQFSGSYTSDKTRMANPQAIMNDMLTPPNYPVYDSTGKYNWYMQNPVADQLNRLKQQSDNLVGNLSLTYNLMRGLNLKVAGGYNRINININNILPSVALFPTVTNSSSIGLNSNQSVIIEPQLDYTKNFTNSRLSLLAGATYQSRISQTRTLTGSNYNTPALMESISAAGTITSANVYTPYKYASVFGRINYSLQDKYILNATARRDGSSRFGPGNRFGNFGSVGAAWLFSNEHGVKEWASWLSYGKLRGSWGMTGNDQITDYQYLSAYSSSTSQTYPGATGLLPSRIANDEFHWEVTRKVELAVELGFLNDRILLNVNRYRNKSDNQLVAYAIPNLTGFSSYQANLPASVENTGWEFELNSKNIQRALTWKTTFNITLPRNELKSFENFATSSYARTLQLGYDITRIFGYQIISINPATGKATYVADPASATGAPYIFNTIGKRTPDFYGGFGNAFTYKGWSLDIFAQFARQQAIGALFSTPGRIQNNYSYVLNRWQKSGDVAILPKSSNTLDGFYVSNASPDIFDASYVRLKNLALSYSFQTAWLKKMNLTQLRVYAEGQNVYTAWHKDLPLTGPEFSSNYSIRNSLPPMKSWVVGLQLSF